jgi:hypothetical protein
MAPTMSWRLEGRLNVVVHSACSPTNLEWQRYMIDVVSRTVPPDARVVVLSRGGSPDGYQRQALVTALGGRPKPVALLTASVIARTTIAAMRLFNPTMKAFTTSDLEGAGEFLGLTVAERERVAQLLVELESELDKSTADQLPARSEAR